MTSRILPLLALAVLTTSCGGGGGGAGSTHGLSQVSLDNVWWPDPGLQNKGPEDLPPGNASLVQLIVFEFSGAPDTTSLDARAIAVTNTDGTQVPGSYEVDGATVTFIPDLPLLPAVSDDDRWQNGGAGFEPDTEYLITVSVGAPDSLRNLAAIAPALRARVGDPDYQNGLRSSFRTTRDPSVFFTGVPRVGPQVIDVWPATGTENISPKLFRDPEQRFTPFTPWHLTFDAPLHPDAGNLDAANIRLVAIEDADGQREHMEIAILSKLVENGLHRAVLEITPSGILPFGHRLNLVVSGALAGLSLTEKGGADQVVSTLRVARAADDRLRDMIVEDFADTSHATDDALDFPAGTISAEWSRLETHFCRASLAFPGAGELGRFIPFPPSNGTREIVLNTDGQLFPLFDGSTPDVPAGTPAIRDGHYNFTRIEIPAGILIRAVGKHPLVLTATKGVLIHGEINVDGGKGQGDATNDSAIYPVPGGRRGPGAGRGGEGHPTRLWPEQRLAYKFFVSPSSGVEGQGAVSGETGGHPGQGGVNSNPEICCLPTQTCMDNRSRGAGGGGGSFYTLGGRGGDGVGDRQADDKGGFVVIAKPLGGEPGPSVFKTETPDDDFIGVGGEVAAIRGGQGGGGAGSRIDSYWCAGQVPGYPDTITDSRGGGGGGGGGGLEIASLADIVLDKLAFLHAHGGNGGGGEQLTCSNWGGSAGGGSGGALLLRCAQQIHLGPQAVLDVTGGNGAGSVDSTEIRWDCSPPAGGGKGSGGNGGHGLVQLSVPPGTTPDIAPGAQVIPATSLVPPERAPSSITPISLAVSRFYDLGRTVARPPLGRMPDFYFRGTDANGYVITDADGFIPDPRHVDFAIALLPEFDDLGGVLVEGHDDYIPENASVRIEFQAANAERPGSGAIDPASVTPWNASIEVADGHQFVRFRVTFNIAADGSPLSNLALRPVLRWIRLPFVF